MTKYFVLFIFIFSSTLCLSSEPYSFTYLDPYEEVATDYFLSPGSGHVKLIASHSTFKRTHYKWVRCDHDNKDRIMYLLGSYKMSQQQIADQYAAKKAQRDKGQQTLFVFGFKKGPHE